MTQQTKTPRKELVQLRQILTECFDESELRTLCFDLGVDYTDLPGEGKGDKARELIAYLERHDRTSELVETCRRLRPALATTAPFTKEDHPELGYLIVWYDRQGEIGPTPPHDATRVEGEVLVETVSRHINSNTIAFWLEDGRYGTIQIHKGLRGRVSKQWKIASFSGPWQVKNLTMIKFHVIGGLLETRRTN